MTREEMKAYLKAQREGFEEMHRFEVMNLRTRTFVDRLADFERAMAMGISLGYRLPKHQRTVNPLWELLHRAG